ncbi:MAG: glycosyltransferase family 2 protein [Rhodoglobus sp.]
MTGSTLDLPTLAVVVPCLNEQDSIGPAVERLLGEIDAMAAAGLISATSFVFIVDDGSKDATWALLTQAQMKDPRVRGLRLSRNFGHQPALMAGISSVYDAADISVSIDADLQQEPAAMRRFVEAYLDGANIVLGVRRDRDSDGLGKKATASGFYWLMRTMGVDVVANHADYRLLDKQAMRALLSFPETNLFVRGICSLLGFDTRVVMFDVQERQFGTTKYSLRKMLRFAIYAITSFSVVPLRLISLLGIVSFAVTLGMVVFVAYSALFTHGTVPGWASTLLPIYFFAGVQLLAIGVLGEYVGKIYSTVQQRPRWIEWDRLEPTPPAERRSGTPV